jgi:IS30 family transposase
VNLYYKRIIPKVWSLNILVEVEPKRGTSQNAIVKALAKSQGTISKEISRNQGLQIVFHNKKL